RTAIAQQHTVGGVLMTHPDLGSAAERMATLIRKVPDDALDAATPCPKYSLGDLVEHVGWLSLAFTAAANKELGGASAQGPSGDASRLEDDWRDQIPRRLHALAHAPGATRSRPGSTRSRRPGAIRTGGPG